MLSCEYSLPSRQIRDSTHEAIDAADTHMQWNERTLLPNAVAIIGNVEPECSTHPFVCTTVKRTWLI